MIDETTEVQGLRLIASLYHFVNIHAPLHTQRLLKIHTMHPHQCYSQQQSCVSRWHFLLTNRSFVFYRRRSLVQSRLRECAMFAGTIANSRIRILLLVGLGRVSSLKWESTRHQACSYNTWWHSCSTASVSLKPAPRISYLVLARLILTLDSFQCLFFTVVSWSQWCQRCGKGRLQCVV